MWKKYSEFYHLVIGIHFLLTSIRAMLDEYGKLLITNLKMKAFCQEIKECCSIHTTLIALPVLVITSS